MNHQRSTLWQETKWSLVVYDFFGHKELKA